MDPARKRKTRFVVALAAALLLATALMYTSFNASSEAKMPSELLKGAEQGRSYQLTGKVVPGSVERDGATTHFEVRDRNGRAKVAVTYTGALPDTFREDRELVVDVRQQAGGGFVGEKDTLVTKCPSKFSDKRKQDPSTVTPVPATADAT